MLDEHARIIGALMAGVGDGIHKQRGVRFQLFKRAVVRTVDGFRPFIYAAGLCRKYVSPSAAPLNKLMPAFSPESRRCSGLYRKRAVVFQKYRAVDRAVVYALHGLAVTVFCPVAALHSVKRGIEL